MSDKRIVLFGRFYCIFMLLCSISLLFLILTLDYPPGSPPAHRRNEQSHSLENFDRQLDIEYKVKAGAENMMRMYSNSKSSKEKKLFIEAQQMCHDSKQKIEVLRMKIMRLQRPAPEGEVVTQSDLLSKPEGRVSYLRYRIEVESRLMEGAQKIMKAVDKKSQSSTVSMIIIIITCNL